MQRDMPPRGGDRTAGPRPCPRCGAALRTSHREYAGGGNSATVLRCVACGHTLSGPTRSDAERSERTHGPEAVTSRSHVNLSRPRRYTLHNQPGRRQLTGPLAQAARAGNQGWCPEHPDC